MNNLLLRTYVRSLTLCAVILLLAAAMMPAQQQEFIPKSKRTIERDRLQQERERKRIVSSGIATITQTRFQYKFGKVNPTGTPESQTRYDGKGNITRVTLYNPSDGKPSTVTSYLYDKNGNVIEEQVKKDENSLKTIHRYNSRNDRIETVMYKADGAVDRKFSYIYDETGLLLETFGRLDDGKIFQRESFLYDGHGNITEYRNNLRKFTIAYDRNGNIAAVVKYQRYFRSVDSIQYTVQERFAFDYDRYGNPVEVRMFRADSTVRSRTQYMYSESGNLLSEKEYGADGKLLFTKNMKYDRNMNLVEESGADRSLKFRHQYKYDSRGNRVEWTIYDQINEPVSLVKYAFNRSGSSQPPGPGMGGAGDTLFADESANADLFPLLGSRVIAPDGTYLGMVLADTANPQSIINTWGQYGFTQSPTSIFNPTVAYGGEEGLFSPFNPESPSPPSLYKDGKFFTYLTDNDNFRPRSAPRRLIEFLKGLVRQN
ncbi:MAG: RHS repeat protein [Bacteroidetes bacterium]|nr:RHS repeat protein [Bacteroidota bacterium]